MAKVTLLQVAAAAEVSKTTASDVLRGAEEGYNAETIGHVRRIAAQLGYKANAAARLLRQNRTNLIGIAVGVRQRPHVNRMVVEVHDECLRRGYQPVIFEPAHLLPRAGYSPFPSPDILAGILSLDLSVEHSIPDFYKTLSQQLPVIALSPAPRGLDSVSTDWPAGLRLAVEHLVSLGHRRIAYAHDPQSVLATDRRRALMWKKCQAEFSLENASQEIVYRTPPAWMESGQQVVNLPQPIAEYTAQILEALITAKPRPTALICTSDDLALALMGRLSALGWKLPEQLSIVGFYNSNLGEFVHPRLTTVASPLDVLVPRALDRLQEAIAAYAEGHPLKPSAQTIKPSLVVRESTSVIGE